MRSRLFAQASVALLAFLGFARAQVPVPAVGETMPASRQVQLPVLTPAIPTPTLLPEPTGAGCPCSCANGGTRFAVDALLGQQIGIRGQVAVWRAPDQGLVLEGYY